MARYEDAYLPPWILGTLIVIVMTFLLLAICFGGYHTCCLGHNILTDDFDTHLIAVPSCSTGIESPRRRIPPVHVNGEVV